MLDPFMSKQEGVQYNKTKRTAARQKAILYYLVAGYIVYMVYCIIRNRIAGDVTMSLPAAVICICSLAAGALWIIGYTTMKLKQELKEARIDSTNKSDKTK